MGVKRSDEKDPGLGEEAEFRGTFIIAAVNSAQGFLARVLASNTREQAIEALEGAIEWLIRAKSAVEHGKMPDGFGMPDLRPAAPRLPLERLDIDSDED